MPAESFNAQHIVNGWLEQLNPAEPALRLDEYGQCLLTSGGGDICIVFLPEPASPLFHLYIDILPVAAPLDSRICQEALALNLLGRETEGGFLGFDRQAGTIVFSIAREVATSDVGGFCNALDGFLAVAAKLRKRLASVTRTDESSSATFGPALRRLGKPATFGKEKAL